MGHLQKTIQKLRKNLYLCVFFSLRGLFSQDSVICLEEEQTAPEKSKTQKPLRSLNEVLGKAAPAGKETKAVPGNLSH